MRRFFEPASAPAWLKPLLGSLRAALGDVWDVPLRPAQFATADLPTAADYRGGLAYNLTNIRVTWSDGSGWLELQPYDADLAAIAALSTTGLVARTGAGGFSLRSITGTADQITVTNGGGVLGEPTLSLPSAVILPGSLAVTATLSCDGNATLGNATSDAHTVNGALNNTLAAGAINHLASGGVLLNVRPSSGQAGRITITEDSVADRWSFGTLAGDDALYFDDGGTVSSTTYVMRLKAAGVSVIGTITSTVSYGFATGAGGAVTQLTSKATGVTLDKAHGVVTMNNAALAGATVVSHTLTSNKIAATDQVICSHVSGGTSGAYTINAFPGSGSAVISVRNNTAGSLSEAIVYRFTVIKGVNS